MHSYAILCFHPTSSTVEVQFQYSRTQHVQRMHESRLLKASVRLHDFFVGHDSHCVRLCDFDWIESCGVVGNKDARLYVASRQNHRVTSTRVWHREAAATVHRRTSVNNSGNGYRSCVFCTGCVVLGKAQKKKENSTVDTFLACSKRTIWAVNPPKRTRGKILFIVLFLHTKQAVKKIELKFKLSSMALKYIFHWSPL